MYSIVLAPNEILRRPTSPVNISGSKLQKIISEMKQILLSQKDPEGVGLAANQIGLPYSLFVTKFDTKPNEPIHTFINPEILDHSEDLQPEKDKKAPLEGCLSLPNYYGIVKRWKWVKIRYQTLSDIDRQTTKSKTSDHSGYLTTSEKVFAGFPATVIQHEMDHLSGKIFVEKILEQKGKLYKATGKNKKGKDIWEEVEI